MPPPASRLAALGVLSVLVLVFAWNAGTAAQYFDWRSAAVASVRTVHEVHLARPLPLPSAAQPQSQPSQPTAERRDQPQVYVQALPQAQAASRASVDPVSRKGGSPAAGCPGSGPPWRAAPLGGNGLQQILEAVRLAEPARPAVAGASGCPYLSAADNANWNLASRLVGSVPESAQEVEWQNATEAVDRSQRAASRWLASPPPPPPPSAPSPPPPPPPPPCHGPVMDCLFGLVQSVRVYDFLTGELSTPSRRHMPPIDAAGERATPAWDEAGTVWACHGQDCGAGSEAEVVAGGASQSRRVVPALEARGAAEMLRRMWDAWEPQLSRELREDECRYRQADPDRRQSRGECAAAAAARTSDAGAAAHLEEISAEGRGAEAAAIDEFVRLVIEPNTAKFANEPCRRRCGEDAVCEYCGTNLCCTRGAPDNAGGACAGLGGERAACTSVPAVEASAAARAQMARALAARLVLAAGAVDYAAPVDMTRLEIVLGLKPEPEPARPDADAGGGAKGGAAGGVASPAAAVQERLPATVTGDKAGVRSSGDPVSSSGVGVPVDCVGSRSGAARWLSCGSLGPHRAGDLEKEGELEAAVAARAWRAGPGDRPELVLTYANEVGTAWVRERAHPPRACGRGRSGNRRDHSAALGIRAPGSSWPFPPAGGRCIPDPSACSPPPPGIRPAIALESAPCACPNPPRPPRHLTLAVPYRPLRPWPPSPLSGGQPRPVAAIHRPRQLARRLHFRRPLRRTALVPPPHLVWLDLMAGARRAAGTARGCRRDKRRASCGLARARVGV